MTLNEAMHLQAFGEQINVKVTIFEECGVYGVNYCDAQTFSANRANQDLMGLAAQVAA